MRLLKVNDEQIIDKCKHESQVLATCDQFKKIKLSDDTGCLVFPLSERWLNGEEYAFILRHYRAYKMLYPETTITHCSHPEKVYE